MLHFLSLTIYVQTRNYETHTNKVFPRLKCGNMFSSHDEMSNNISKMHNRRNSKQCNAIADTIYICGECKFSSKNKKEFQEPPEACETSDNETYKAENTCFKYGHTFLTSDLLNKHTRHHIKATGLHICEQCNWNSKYQRELKSPCQRSSQTGKKEAKPF